MCYIFSIVAYSTYNKVSLLCSSELQTYCFDTGLPFSLWITKSVKVYANEVLRDESKNGCWGGVQAYLRNFAACGWTKICAGIAGKMCQAGCWRSINASELDLRVVTWGVNDTWCYIIVILMLYSVHLCLWSHSQNDWVTFINLWQRNIVTGKGAGQ